MAVGEPMSEVVLAELVMELQQHLAALSRVSGRLAQFSIQLNMQQLTWIWSVPQEALWPEPSLWPRGWQCYSSTASPGASRPPITP
jgi:hypothetical protein